MAGKETDVDLRITSLASERGRQQAAALNILSVPTILVGTTPIRLTGVPTRAALMEAIEQARNGD